MQSRVAAARSIVNRLYPLSRQVRLFGWGSARADARLASSVERIRELIPAGGLTVQRSGDGLSVDGIGLELTPAEQSFARFLRESERQAMQFDASFTIEALREIVSAIAFEPLTLPSAGQPLPMNDAGQEQREWLKDPFGLLSFLNVAIHDLAPNTDRRSQGTASPVSSQASEDIAQTLHVLGKLGNSATESDAQGAARGLYRVPESLLRSTREILMEFSAVRVSLSGNTLLLRVADQIVLRFMLAKLESGELSVEDTPALLERLGRQLYTLRTLLPLDLSKPGRVSVTLEASLEALERELWDRAPDAALRQMLLSDRAYIVPASSIEAYLKRIIANGEDQVAETILRNYAAAVDGRDAEGRRRAAKGIGELAELYALVIEEFVPKLMRSVARQLLREAKLQMQSFLSTALVRLSYAVQQQRDFVGTAAASDALEEISHRRASLGTELRARVAIESRIPEYLDEALSLQHVSDDLAGVLQRHASVVTQQLCARFLSCTLREESARLTNLAARLGDEAREELVRRLQSGSSEDALSAVGLISSLAQDEAAAILPRRVSDWNVAQQRVLIRQLGIGVAANRGELLMKLLPHLDALIIPGAIDEVGMSSDVEAAGSLFDIVMAGENPRFTAYSKVKALEALGRLHAANAADALLEMLNSRKMLHWMQPHELRIAGLQALHMIDPERAQRFVPRSGITPRELSVGPLAIDPENPWARQRRYSRVAPKKPMVATATSRSGKAGLDIMELSLGGGRARRHEKMQPGGDVTVHLQFALRRLNSEVLVREVAGNEITFEIADIGLSDRSRLRHLLLAQSPAPSPHLAA